MDFISFLTQATNPAFWAQHPHICFTGSEYSPLFFNNLITYIDKNSLLPYPKVKLNIAEIDKNALLAALNQSMLGNYYVFWAGNLLHEKLEKSMHDILLIIAAYKGPHHLIYFLPKDSKIPPGKTTHFIELPLTIDFSLFKQILSFFQNAIHEKKLKIIEPLFKQANAIALDVACMLISYLELIGLKEANLVSHYFSNLTQNQPSLNQLSEYFFEGNAVKFFSIWTKIEKDYSEMFWIIFWTEQLWKAYHVISYLKKNDFVNAKRMGFRLPYSFINGGWKKFNNLILMDLFNNLYFIDTKIKNGRTSDVGLSFFFFSYFFEKTNKQLKLSLN